MSDQTKYQNELMFELANSNENTTSFYSNVILPLILKLKECGAKDLNFYNLLGDTITHICVENRLILILDLIHAFCAQWSNDLKIDLNLKNLKAGHTPIATAAFKGDEPLFGWLLSAVQTNEDKYLEMWASCEMSSKRIPYMHYDTQGISALICPGNFKKRKENETKPNALVLVQKSMSQDYSVRTEFMEDVKPYALVLVRKPMSRDYFGRTEFMEDVKNDKIHSLRAALEACHSTYEKSMLVNTQDDCGRSALIEACIMGYADIVQLLIPYADVNQADDNGQTPLHFAVFYLKRVRPMNQGYRSQILEMLLLNGAKVLKNLYDKTPADFAQEMAIGYALSILKSYDVYRPKEYTPMLSGLITLKLENLDLTESKGPLTQHDANITIEASNEELLKDKTEPRVQSKGRENKSP